MKLLFDQNISCRIVKKVTGVFINSSHVSMMGLTNATDYQIWEYAKQNNFTIVTHDSDFYDLYILHGKPPKIVWLKTGNIKTGELVSVIEKHFEDIKEFIENKELGCLEIFRYVE